MLLKGEVIDYIEADRTHDGFVHAIDLEKNSEAYFKRNVKSRSHPCLALRHALFFRPWGNPAACGKQVELSDLPFAEGEASKMELK